jgi:5-formyltetrahydrofolate cyclo-ligase
MDKKELRRQIRELKRAMTEEQIVSASQRLGELFLASDYYKNAKTIYGYLPYNQEVRTVPMLEQALRDGKRVALPKCRGEEMRFLWVDDFDHLEISALGSPQPAADGPEADDSQALVLMPGLAFDRAGNRIGYGGGFYDRFLSREPGHPTVALCYDFQMVDRLECDKFDIPVDLVLWA